ncbi:MAG: hypothetical protein ACE5FZ_00535 [Nitrospiria bacterium]
MNSKFGNKRGIGGFSRKLALLSIGILLSGCTHISTLKPTMNQSRDIVKIPISVGIYYSPEFKTYNQDRKTGPHRWVIPLGQASVAAFDQAIKKVFDRTIHVSSRPPFTHNNYKVDTVIEPKIEHFNFDLPLFMGTYSAEVVYRITLYSSDGTPFISWTVRGTGERPSGFDYLTHATPIGEATDLAIQGAITKFMTGFSDVPEVKNWLRKEKTSGH